MKKAIRASGRSGRFELVLFFIFLAIGPHLARSAGPVISGPFAVAPANVTRKAGDQMYPAMATNGGHSLLVWREGSTAAGARSAIYGCRLGPNGERVDANGILIFEVFNTSSLQIGFPAVESNGADFLVVWTMVGSMNAARVGFDGSVGPTISIPLTWMSGAAPSIASIGANYLLVGRAYSLGPPPCPDCMPPTLQRIQGVFINGNVATASFQFGSSEITASDQYPLLPVVKANGNEYFVAYSKGTQLLGRRVSSAGIILDSQSIAISSTSFSRFDLLGTQPRLTSLGENFFVVWEDGRAGKRDVYGARINSVGEVLDPNGVLIAPGTQAAPQPAVTSDGQSYFAAWTDEARNVLGRRINADGSLTGHNQIVIASNEANPAPTVAPMSGKFLVSWQSVSTSSLNGYDIFFAFVDENDSVSGATLVTTGGGKSLPRVSFNGENYLVVWQDTRSNSAGTSIYGCRLSQTGEILDPAGIQISQGGNDVSPDVIVLGDDFLCVWLLADYSGGLFKIMANRINPSGQVKDGGGVTLASISLSGSAGSGSFMAPSVASLGASGLVAFRMSTNSFPNPGFSGYALVGIRLENSADSLKTNNPAILTVLPDSYLDSMQLAASSNNYLLHWGRTNNLYAILVQSDGTVASPNPVEICTANGRRSFSTVAGNAGGFLAAWADDRNAGSSGRDIYAAHVSLQGVVEGFQGFPLTTAVGTQTAPAIASNGTDFLVAWQDGTSSGSVSLRARSLDRPGNITPEFTIATGLSPQNVPALGNGRNDGSYLLVAESAPSIPSLAGWFIDGASYLQSGFRLLAPTFNPDGSVNLRWFGEAGVSYQLQYNDNLDSAAWSNLGGSLLGNDAVITGHDDAPVYSARFYQVQKL